MSKRRIALIAVALVAVLGGVLAALFLLRPEPETPPPPSPEAPPEEERPALPDERNAVLNLYFGTPFELRDVDRIELTLVRVDVITDAGVEYAADTPNAKLSLSRGVVQKTVSAPIFHGDVGRLRLTFGPTARIFSLDGRQEFAFVPSARVETEIGEKLEASRTLAVYLPLPPNVALGKRDGNTTFLLPERAESESAILGGFLLNERAAGRLYEPETMDLAGIVQADLGLNIRSNGRERSPGFTSPPSAQPQ